MSSQRSVDCRRLRIDSLCGSMACAQFSTCRHVDEPSVPRILVILHDLCHSTPHFFLCSQFLLLWCTDETCFLRPFPTVSLVEKSTTVLALTHKLRLGCDAEKCQVSAACISCRALCSRPEDHLGREHSLAYVTLR